MTSLSLVREIYRKKLSRRNIPFCSTAQGLKAWFFFNFEIKMQNKLWIRWCNLRSWCLKWKDKTLIYYWIAPWKKIFFFSISFFTFWSNSYPWKRPKVAAIRHKCLIGVIGICGAKHFELGQVKYSERPYNSSPTERLVSHGHGIIMVVLIFDLVSGVLEIWKSDNPNDWEKFNSQYLLSTQQFNYLRKQKHA